MILGKNRSGLKKVRAKNIYYSLRSIGLLPKILILEALSGNALIYYVNPYSTAIEILTILIKQAL